MNRTIDGYNQNAVAVRRTPTILFEVQTLSGPGYSDVEEYDVTADGKRFIVASTGGTTGRG